MVKPLYQTGRGAELAPHLLRGGGEDDVEDNSFVYFAGTYLIPAPDLPRLRVGQLAFIGLVDPHGAGLVFGDLG